MNPTVQQPRAGPGSRGASKLTVLIRGAMCDAISPLLITQAEKPNPNKQKGCHDCAAVNINQSNLDILNDSLLTGILYYG